MLSSRFRSTCENVKRKFPCHYPFAHLHKIKFAVSYAHTHYWAPFEVERCRLGVRIFNCSAGETALCLRAARTLYMALQTARATAPICLGSDKLETQPTLIYVPCERAASIRRRPDTAPEPASRRVGPDQR